MMMPPLHMLPLLIIERRASPAAAIFAAFDAATLIHKMSASSLLSVIIAAIRHTPSPTAMIHFVIIVAARYLRR